MNHIKTAAIAAAAALGLADLAHSQNVLIDFGNASSFRGLDAPSPDANNNHWNSVWSGAFYPDLVDTTGAATGVDFGFGSVVTGTDSFNGPAGVTSSGTLQDDVLFTDIDSVALGPLGGSLEAAFDYYVSSQFQVQQLNPTKVYDLTFFGSHKFNNDDVTRYTVYSDSAYTQVVASVDLEVGVGPNHNRDTVAVIQGLPGPANDNNIYYIGFEGANGGNGYLNAMLIEEAGDFLPSVVDVADFGAFYELDGFLPDNVLPDTSWNTGVVTPGADALNVNSVGTGGGFDVLPGDFVNASATDTIELVVDVKSGDFPNVVTLLEDGDGTQHRFTFGTLDVGQHTLTFPVDGVGLSSSDDRATLGNAGTTPGLDLSDLFAFQIQVETGESAAYDVDFISLRLFDGDDMAGDYNGDGLVDAADYTVARDNGLDLAVWRANYGARATLSVAASASAVPEPTAAFGALLASLGAVVHSRRR